MATLARENVRALLTGGHYGRGGQLIQLPPGTHTHASFEHPGPGMALADTDPSERVEVFYFRSSGFVDPASGNIEVWTPNGAAQPAVDYLGPRFTASAPNLHELLRRLSRDKGLCWCVFKGHQHSEACQVATALFS